jgi:acyl-CoA synthetase (AMP-forming)/AMP-acid ligase II
VAMPGATLIENLERSAAAFGDRCAIAGAGATLSFAELRSQARALARHLCRGGLARGDRVALLVENSAEFVIAYYGALYAGGVIVALNAASKARDFAGWIEHAEATWLLARDTDETARLVSEGGAPRRRILLGPGGSGQGVYDISLDEILATPPADELPRPPAPRELAAIVFTSGTTGRPKGVALSHGNLASNTSAIVEYLRLDNTDSVLCVLPFYYSYGASVLHSHLAAGARIVLEDNLVYPHRVVERLVAEHCTGFAGVPSTYSLLLSRVDLAGYDLSSLRYATQAGGPMPVPVTRRLQAALPRTRIFVMYGQTEATARLTYLPPERLTEKLGSVGIPIPGVEIEVRRADGNRAEANESGEIWVRGPNVMSGYWRDPQATAAVLADGWLRTGDEGRMDADGFLYIEGRRSDIIKTGAHRVHPADIECVAADCPGVAEAAAVGVDDDILGQVIKLFVVATPGATIDAMAIKARMRAELPNYKVPKFLEIVPALPKTATGKLRRHELTSRRAS